jgi:hypothetical protein
VMARKPSDTQPAPNVVRQETLRSTLRVSAKSADYLT